LFVFLVPMRGGTEKADLLSIAPTPFAENQMNAQADALPQPKRVVQRLGLQPRRLTAIGRKLARLSEESLQHFHQRIHCYLSFTAIQTNDGPTLGFVVGPKLTLHLKFRTQP
jgi:hypothetical protein